MRLWAFFRASLNRTVCSESKLVMRLLRGMEDTAWNILDGDRRDVNLDVCRYFNLHARWLLPSEVTILGRDILKFFDFTRC